MEIDKEDFIRFLTIKKGLAKNTIRMCGVRFNLINTWISDTNNALSNTAIEKFFSYLKETGRQDGSINAYLFTLRYLSEYCKDRKMIYDFVDGFKTRKSKSRTDIQIFTVEQVKKLLQVNLTYGIYHGKKTSKHLNTMYKLFTMALAFTGARFSEMADIKVSDINFGSKQVIFTDTKNGEKRKVDIPDRLYNKLCLYTKNKQPLERVFTNSQGKRIDNAEYITDLRKRACAAGIPPSIRVYPHLLRHTFASHLFMYGNVDLATIARILGHKNVQQTYDAYLHLADDQKRKAHFSHPLLREEVPPKEKIENLIETIKSFRLDTDSRFDPLSVLEAQQKYILALHKATIARSS